LEYRLRTANQVKIDHRFIKVIFITFLFIHLFTQILCASSASIAQQSKKNWTIMFYLNGDNDLSYEVLYALDMLETVGSSSDVNILALYDGKSGGEHGYGEGWDGTRLIYVTRDDHIGKINSVILENHDELNLGAPETLENFIRYCLDYPAKRYMFATFSHGRGIIDTKTLSSTGPHKSLAISLDETNRSQLNLQQFHAAIKNGLDGKRFDLMVFFSCLTNMAEVGYALKDVTHFLIGSEDEIRIVNVPPGAFQIRGIKFEEPLSALRSNPELTVLDFAKITIDTFIEQYVSTLELKDDSGHPYYCRYPAGMALVNCRAYDRFAAYLDNLAQYIAKRIQDSESGYHLANEMRLALSATQRYNSFLNLEYYDLQDFLLNLAETTKDASLAGLCLATSEYIKRKIVIYERHTSNSASHGISIYLSHCLIPDNVFQAHQEQYRQSRFSRDTAWDEMIEVIRKEMKK
jgi:hypothetical protein